MRLSQKIFVVAMKKRMHFFIHCFRSGDKGSGDFDGRGFACRKRFAELGGSHFVQGVRHGKQ